MGFCGPAPSSIQSFSGPSGCQVRPKLQQGAEVHPGFLGLSTDTLFLEQRFRWVFRDGIDYGLSHDKWRPQEQLDVRDRVIAVFNKFFRPVDNCQNIDCGPFHPGSEEAHSIDFRLVFLWKYLVGTLLDVQGRILHYFLDPFLMFFPGQ